MRIITVSGNTMQPLRYLLLIGLAAFSLYASSCKKWFDTQHKADELPPETQVGANTFGCKINGQVWLPKGNFYTLRWRVDIFSLTQMTISAARAEGDSTTLLTFSVFNDSIIYPRTYILDNPSNRRVRYGNLSTCYYESQTGNQSQLIITKQDMANRIISGRFSASFPAQAGCPPVEITEGRFDIKY